MDTAPLTGPSWIAAALLAALLAACGGDDAGEAGTSGLDALSQSAPASPAVAALNRMLPQVGEPLPAIVGSTLDGEQIDNASLHGRTVLLNLWFVH